MIRFERLEKERDQLKQEFHKARPFPHVVIDDFCDAGSLVQLYAQIPVPSRTQRTGDYVFAKNKYQESNFKDLSQHFLELHDELISPRFEALLRFITGEEVFVDRSFYGGGIHQGGTGSYLDMHADFNYHPLHTDWFRNLNLLLYLNKNWQKEYGGELKLRHAVTGEAASVDVPFNRMVIMLDRSFTLHGYDPISFPEGTFRTSVASYAYSQHEVRVEAPRSTLWTPSEDKLFKRLIAVCAPGLISLKNRLVRGVRRFRG